VAMDPPGPADPPERRRVGGSTASMTDPLHTAQKAAPEALGISLTKIGLFALAIDEGSLPGQSVSPIWRFRGIGSAGGDFTGRAARRCTLGGRDKFESAEFVALVLSAGSIVKVLSQHRLKSGFRNRWSR
jgi:hypothetical protein